jgi:ketosteroid isomerase-like protein
VSNENKQKARRFFETLSGGDLEELWSSFLDDESTWTVRAVDILGAGTAKGRAIVDEFLTPVRGLFEPGNPRVDVKNVLADGPFVVVEAEGHGRFRDGSAYDNVYCFVLEIEGGKVRSLSEYMDTGYARRVVARATGEAGA